MYVSLYRNRGRLFQYLATFSATFSVITSGINLGWTSPYLPQLLLPSAPIPTTSDEGSWCAIMPLVGAPVGALIAAILGDIIGRKNTTLLMTPVVLLSLIGMAVAPSILLLSVLRFIIGATEGALYTVLPMYIGEISHPSIRGFLSSMVAIAGIIGTLLINILGQKFSIFTSSLICCLIPIIHVATFVWMPESPYFYVKKKKFERAKDSLRILTGREDVTEEIDDLCRVVERQEKNRGKITDLLTIRGNRRACVIFMIVCVTNKFSGKNPCLFYTTMIFEEAGSSISAEMSVIVYCTVELIATLIATFLVDKCGKRPLFIVSTSGCCVSVSLLGAYFYLKDSNIPRFVDDFDWLPIASLVAYNILFSIGLGFATVTVLSELFPTNVKTVAAGMADTFSVSMGAIASKFFQIANDEYGMFVPFWGFGVCCAVGLVLIVKFVPETKGRSLEEIQVYLNGGKWQRDVKNV